MDKNLKAAKKVLTDFLDSCYVNRNTNKILQLLATNAYIYKPDLPTHFITKADFIVYLENEAEQNTIAPSYRIHTFHAKLTPNQSVDLIVSIILVNQNEPDTGCCPYQKWNITATLRLHDNSYLIDVIHFSLATNQQSKKDKLAFIKAQSLLKLVQARYRIILECTEDIIFEYNIPHDVLTLNYNIDTPEGKKNKKVQINSYSTSLYKKSSIHPADLEKIDKVLMDKLSPDNLTLRLKGPQKTIYRWFELRGTWIYNDMQKPFCYTGLLHNIHKQKLQIDALTYKSERDGLTGLYNRQAAEYLIMSTLKKDSQQQHAFIIIDIDYFKQVNDVLGHQFGDSVLVSLAKKLSMTFRYDDIIGRFGGDEFVVFMRDIPSDEMPLERSQHLGKLFRRKFIEAFNQKFSCSIGIAIYKKDGQTFEELYHAADVALYEAKNHGRNRCYMYSREFE
ncbi:GGDEF domain-containing protein [Propionispira raffinosivorans]|uniref:GGDEF domain-containing protein n=1 Tax=Propionispira raffinosivorans TaxID=86959 RepID=UPI00038025D9|nr:GGDEF domain-containing protein [Propionispira raffinosivorans]